MKLVTYRHAGTKSYGVVRGDDIVDRTTLGLSAATVRDLIASNQRPSADAVASASATASLADVELLPPVTPGKILCAGVNFAPHRAEGGLAPERGEYPVIFARFAESLVGDGQPIRKPVFTDAFDYEAELGVVIGERAWQVPVESALDHVYGYTCFNDGTVRDWQRHSPQWIPGKNFWQSGGIGPWIVTVDESGHLDQSRMQARVNGDVRQDAILGEMLFSTAELIAYISQFTPLEPGDVIAAGTPGGVGFYMDPPGLLSDGDLVEIEIEGIGILANRVAEA